MREANSRRRGSGSTWLESPAAEARLTSVRQALQAAIRETQKRRPDLTLQALSRALRRSPNYWPRALRGAGKLRFVEVCKVLEVLGLDPGVFFLATFRPELAEPGRPAGSPSPSGPSVPRLRLEALEAPMRQAARRHSPEHWESRCRKLLSREISASGRTQRQLGEELNPRTPEALSRVLWGDTSLTLRHVFLVLEALGVEPESFFFEVFAPGEGEVLPGLDIPALLVKLDPLHRAVVEAQGDGKGPESEP